MKFLNNQKGAMQVVVIIVLVAGLIAGVYLVGQITGLFPKAVGPKYIPVDKAIEQVTERMPAINTKADLLNRLQDLESTSLEELRKGVNENNSDASTF